MTSRHAPGTGTRHAIEAAALVKTYAKEIRALDGLSFTVREGEIFGLLGPNGAGKSTAVRILTTLSRPDTGSARVAGEDVLARPDVVRRAIGVVGQRSGVDRDATGGENLRLQGRLHGLHGRALRGHAAALLDRFGLADAADRIVRGYSGGMQRRLDIAMSLIHRPSVLFLDEPTTGLDPEVRVDLWREIERLVSEEGLTILLTTHYLEEADRLASELAIVDHGRVVVTGTPEHLKSGLQGDAIHAELAERANGAVHAALDRVAGVHELALEGMTLRARADEGARAVPHLLQALESHGVQVISVTVSRPSLDDVYLRHAGRSLKDEQPG